MFSAGPREAGELDERVSLPRVDPVSGSGLLAHAEKWMLEYRDGVVGALELFFFQATPAESLTSRNLGKYPFQS